MCEEKTVWLRQAKVFKNTNASDFTPLSYTRGGEPFYSQGPFGYS